MNDVTSYKKQIMFQESMKEITDKLEKETAGSVRKY